MANITNELVCASEREENFKTTKKAFESCKKREKEQIEKGWKWVKVGARTQVLVPCDDNGNPTEIGQKKIKKLSDFLGLTKR